jgi:hypothetical protein
MQHLRGMTRRRTYRAACAALVVPLIVLVGFRSAWALYACRVDGQVRASCCCKAKHKQHDAPRAPTVKPAMCCDVTVQAAPSVPQLRDTERASTQPPPMIVTSVATAAPIAPIARAIAIARPTARPPPTATFLLKQSFLR